MPSEESKVAFVVDIEQNKGSVATGSEGLRFFAIAEHLNNMIMQLTDLIRHESYEPNRLQFRDQINSLFNILRTRLVYGEKEVPQVPQDGVAREYFEYYKKTHSRLELGYRNSAHEMDGPGVQMSNDTYFEGLWSRGTFVRGIKIDKYGELYEGGFMNGKLQGQGIKMSWHQKKNLSCYNKVEAFYEDDQARGWCVEDGYK